MVMKSLVVTLLACAVGSEAFMPSHTPAAAFLGHSRGIAACRSTSMRPAVARGMALLRMDSEIPPNKAASVIADSIVDSGMVVKSGTVDEVVQLVDSKRKNRAAESQVICIGLSHNTATVEVREKLAVPEGDWQQVGRELAKLPTIDEAAVISTCNRFEIYIATTDLHKGVREVYEYLNRRSGVSLTELKDRLFTLSGVDGVWHALRVSGGLDSLVIGEGQILSQMKRCYELATEPKAGAAGKVLTRLLNTAVAAGKRVRAETGISRGGVSISSAAVELVVQKSVGVLGLEIHQLDICILGAGKMARLLVQHLAPHQVKSLHICNRSPAGPQELIDMFPGANIIAHGMDEMLEQTAKCHVTFACTSAREPILTKQNCEPVIDRPVMIVDISVPRNIEDKELNTIPNCNAYNVDDLKSVVQANQAKRRKLVIEAEEVLQEELELFNNWHQSLGTIPTISKLQSRAEVIRHAEIRKMHNKLSGLSPAERAVVERLTKGIVAKLIHGPMAHLRTVDNVEDRRTTVKSLERMFNLLGDDTM